jgi:condensin complex subunit 2
MGGLNEDVPMDFGGDPAGGEPGGIVQDFFVGDQAVHDDYGGDEFSGPGDGIEGAPEGDTYAAAQGNEPGARPNGGFEPFDPRRMPNERDLVMAMTEAEGEGGMMDYFDQNFLKNWAGPEHWKLRKIVRKGAWFLSYTSCDQRCLFSRRLHTVDPAEHAAPKAKREKKEAFKIDFSAPLETSVKDLFTPVTGKGMGINLPVSKSSVRKAGKKGKAKDAEKRSAQTLPDDMHFSSRQLVTLFLKPKFSVSDSLSQL